MATLAVAGTLIMSAHDRDFDGVFPWGASIGLTGTVTCVRWGESQELVSCGLKK